MVPLVSVLLYFDFYFFWLWLHWAFHLHFYFRFDDCSRERSYANILDRSEKFWRFHSRGSRREFTVDWSLGIRKHSVGRLNKFDLIFHVHIFFLNICSPRKLCYNLTSSREILIRWEDIIKIGLNLTHKYCFSFLLWYPSGHCTRHYWLYKFYSLFCHWIPAYVLDTLVSLFGYKKLCVL